MLGLSILAKKEADNYKRSSLNQEFERYLKRKNVRSQIKIYERQEAEIEGGLVARFD